MSSSILHQCPFCGHVSDISLSLPAFIENPHCIQCGLSVSEGNGKIQDELAALFDQQMAIEPRPEPQAVSYSISQHYHHSSHVISPPSPHTQPHQAQNPIDTLWRHGIDPSTLLPYQLDLFKHADAEQQERLIQTWQVYARSVGTSVDQSSPSSMQGDHPMDDPKIDAEPYMVSGYDASSSHAEPSTGKPYVSATDPVYKSQHWWEMTQIRSMGSHLQ